MEKIQLQSWPIVLLWIITEGNNPEGGIHTLRGFCIYFTLESKQKGQKTKMLVIIYNLLVLQNIYALLQRGRAPERIVPVTNIK